MFEILKVFVEQAFKLVNVEFFMKNNDRNKLASLGVDLFQLYTALNSIYVTGMSIIDEIERLVAHKKILGMDFETKVRPEEMYTIRHLLRKQKNNIIRFSNHFLKLTRQLDIIDPKLSRSLPMFLSEKQNIITAILDEIDKAAPEDSTESWIRGDDDYLNNSCIFSNTFEMKLLNKSKRRGSYRFFDNLPSEGYGQDQQKVNFSRMRSEHVDALEIYLEIRQPREQMKSLHAILDQFHDALVKNFETKDILARVKPSDRLDDDYIHDRFYP